MKMLISLVLMLSSHMIYAHDAIVSPLILEKELNNFDGGKQIGQMVMVEYEPGGFSPKHRHPAHAFIFVLEGELIMQLEGEKPVHLKEGDVFYEKPDDIHLVSRNASSELPVKFLVFAVMEKGAPLVIPMNDK